LSVKKGDMLWVELKGAPQNYGYGEVVDFWDEPGIGTVFEFHCLVNGGLRMGYEKNIINKPGARMHSKLAEERSALNKVLKEKSSGV
jgi:hypothetical protein